MLNVVQRHKNNTLQDWFQNDRGEEQAMKDNNGESEDGETRDDT